MRSFEWSEPYYRDASRRSLTQALKLLEMGEQAKPLREFLKAIGLPSVKFHTLRACFASQLLSDGVEMTKVMKRRVARYQNYADLFALSGRGRKRCYRWP